MIIDDLYAEAAAVPCEHKAIVAGGLAGAGKTTVLTEQVHAWPFSNEICPPEVTRAHLYPGEITNDACDVLAQPWPSRSARKISAGLSHPSRFDDPEGFV